MENMEIICIDSNSNFLKVLRDTQSGCVYVAHVENNEVKAISDALSYEHSVIAHEDARQGNLHMYDLVDAQ